MALTTTQLIALSQLPGISSSTILNKISPVFLDYANDIEVRVWLAENFKSKKAPISKDQIDHAFFKAEQILEASADLGIKTLSYYESAFPQSLRDVVTDKKRKGMPQKVPVAVIYYKGDLSLLNMDSMAIIGASNCSHYASSASYMMAQHFAGCGFCIVSGLAAGCDAAAHKGAISVTGGKTIAVLPHGLDMVYPPENEWLAQHVLDSGGLLLSECPLGNKPRLYTYIGRNYIQAALSLATLVVESTVTGGSMIAAKAAYNARKLLFVMKYRDAAFNNSPQTEGNHYLASRCGARYLGGYTNKAQMSASLDHVAQYIRDVRSRCGFGG